MPIYEFKCKSCDTIKDKIVPMDTESIKCDCGESMTKTMGSFLFVAHGLPNGHNAVRSKKS